MPFCYIGLKIGGGGGGGRGERLHKYETMEEAAESPQQISLFWLALTTLKVLASSVLFLRKFVSLLF